MTKESLNIALRNLAHEAKLAGLMGELDALIYEPGSRPNGIAPAVSVGRRGSRALFLPRFTHKTTPREVELALDAAAAALFQVNYAAREREAGR